MSVPEGDHRQGQEPQHGTDDQVLFTLVPKVTLSADYTACRHNTPTQVLLLIKNKTLSFLFQEQCFLPSLTQNNFLLFLAAWQYKYTTTNMVQF